jgi:hypothetical protein
MIPLFVILFAAGWLAFGAPADGSWTLNSGQPTNGPSVLQLRVSGTTLTGTADGVPITAGRAADNNLWFNATRQGTAYTYKGTILGNTMNLHETLLDGSQHRAFNYTRN